MAQKNINIFAKEDARKKIEKCRFLHSTDILGSMKAITIVDSRKPANSWDSCLIA
jgi:hypothetical protein